MSASLIVSASLTRFPREACGFVFVNGGLVEIENVSEDPHGFKLKESDAEFWWVLGEVTGVWHSHCFGPAVPTEDDQRLAQPGLECWIYSVPDEELALYRPDEQGRLQLVDMKDLS